MTFFETPGEQTGRRPKDEQMQNVQRSDAYLDRKKKNSVKMMNLQTYFFQFVFLHLISDLNVLIFL